MDPNKIFFAAANGYDGFVSYFDKIFDPRNFTRLYILKGGPGTGKSSLMRKISTALAERGAICESILCSSDKDSLDGIICEKRDRRVAIIDGTSPHERDTLLPGAADEIINLGDFWERKWLTAGRDKIAELNSEKKMAYAAAYAYLKTAGTANREARKFSPLEKYVKSIKTQAKSLAESINAKEGRLKTRLISSFGKSGLYRLNTMESLAKKHYTLVGDNLYTSIFMQHIFNTLKDKNADMIVSPTPLEAADIDALFITGEDIVISRAEGGEIIDLTEFVKNDSLTNERIKSMCDIESNALEAAKRWFGIASDLHFRLEEIYKTCMNFDRNEQITLEKTEEISELLEL